HRGTRQALRRIGNRKGAARGRTGCAGTADRLSGELSRLARLALAAPTPVVRPLGSVAVQGVPIDIVVPVYNAAGDLARCVDSVLAHSSGDWRLLLIDDASPAIAIRTYFSGLRARRLPQVSLHRNERSLGFMQTANRGLAEARPEADVVLLHSDTVVTRDWLGKLARCAASSPHIGTITPFSNHAQICSWPRFCANNPWPKGQDAEPLLTALELCAVPTYPDLPAGMGFCLYIRRGLLFAIGSFDAAFEAGHG